MIVAQHPREELGEGAVKGGNREVKNWGWIVQTCCSQADGMIMQGIGVMQEQISAIQE